MPYVCAEMIPGSISSAAHQCYTTAPPRGCSAPSASCAAHLTRCSTLADDCREQSSESLARRPSEETRAAAQVPVDRLLCRLCRHVHPSLLARHRTICGTLGTEVDCVRAFSTCHSGWPCAELHLSALSLLPSPCVGSPYGLTCFQGPLLLNDRYARAAMCARSRGACPNGHPFVCWKPTL
jgi:hypothetical protein